MCEIKKTHRPKTMLFGRFFECEPNMNSELSVFCANASCQISYTKIILTHLLQIKLNDNMSTNKYSFLLIVYTLLSNTAQCSLLKLVSVCWCAQSPTTTIWANTTPIDKHALWKED